MGLKSMGCIYAILPLLAGVDNMHTPLLATAKFVAFATFYVSNFVKVTGRKYLLTNLDEYMSLFINSCFIAVYRERVLDGKVWWFNFITAHTNKL